MQKSVTYKEEDIIENDDGTISVNSFTMPGEDVIINAVFSYELINPKTGETIPYTTLFILLAMSIGYLVYSKITQVKLNF